MATIENINYNASEKTLDVIFGYDTETVYTYYGVSAEMASELENAESKGKYFHANIRGKLEFSKDAVK